MHTLTSLQDRLGHLMEEIGIDQATLARYTGAQKSQVNHWITGRVKSIDAESAFNLENYTGFSAKWLLTGKGPKKFQDQRSQEVSWGIEAKRDSASFARAVSSKKQTLNRSDELSYLFELSPDWGVLAAIEAARSVLHAAIIYEKSQTNVPTKIKV